MAFTDQCDSIVAKVTDAGWRAVVKSMLPEYAFSYKLDGWNVGRGGYNPANPVKVTAVDTALTDLVDPVRGLGLVRSINLLETAIAPNVVVPVCRLTTSDTSAQYGLGEIGIYATVLHSATPGEAGSSFLFAVAHFPLQSMTPQHTGVWRVMIAF